MPTPILLLLAAWQAIVPFGQVARGEMAEGPLSVAGRVERLAPNDYVLRSSAPVENAADCISLILAADDRAVAERLVGVDAVAQGRPVFVFDLEHPQDSGDLLQGRPYTGTRCEGDVAVFVTSLSAAPAR